MTSEDYAQREENRKKMSNLLSLLRRASPPYRGADTVVGGVSQGGRAMVQMKIHQGLKEVQTIEIWFNVHTDKYVDVVDMLRREYEAMHGTLWLLTYAPDQYNDDVSPHRYTKHQSTDELQMM